MSWVWSHLNRYTCVVVVDLKSSKGPAPQGDERKVGVTNLAYTDGEGDPGLAEQGKVKVECVGSGPSIFSGHGECVKGRPWHILRLMVFVKTSLLRFQKTLGLRRRDVCNSVHFCNEIHQNIEFYGVQLHDLHFSFRIQFYWKLSPLEDFSLYSLIFFHLLWQNLDLNNVTFRLFMPWDIHVNDQIHLLSTYCDETVSLTCLVSAIRMDLNVTFHHWSY